MTRRYSLLILACTTASAVAYAPVPVYKELQSEKLLKQMLGRWEAVAPNALPILVIGKDSWVFTSRDSTGGSQKWRTTLELKQSPATLDLTDIKKTGAEADYQGIVKVEGDTLTWCYSPGGPGFSRPRAFGFSAPGSKPTSPQILIFKRMK